MPVEEKTDQREADEKVVEIELERLRSFTNHPFKVQADSQMIELQDSIRKYGILNPLIVRPRPEGVYEIISGHRRKFAAEKLGYRKVPVIIRAMKDDEAVVSMVDSNLQRERISPSEKAFAYKMKYDAIKRKTGRRKCGQVDLLIGILFDGSHIKLNLAIIDCNQCQWQGLRRDKSPIDTDFVYDVCQSSRA